MRKRAHISECGKYRYCLERIWGTSESPKYVCWIMLNPSTADSEIDDPTIRRCIKFSQKFGYDGMFVVNLFALRATNPKELYKSNDPIGPENLNAITFHEIYDTIAAWGNNKIVKNWMSDNKIFLPDKLYCLGVNKNGSPKHPLYVRGDITLKDWTL